MNTRNTQGKENREHNTADTQGIRRERRTENIIQQKSVKENREHNTADTQGIRRERRTENIIQQKSVKENREHNTAKSVKFHKEIILSFRAQNCSLRSQLVRRGERGAEAQRRERRRGSPLAEAR